MLKALLHRDDKGIGAVEFALVAPVLISFIVGVSQVGRMFYANADMKSAIAAGARVAAVYPVPDDATIIAAVNNRLMRDGASARATPTVVHGTDNGNAYVELRITYSVPLEFIFFSPPPVTLHDTRRVFTQVANANTTTITATSASSASSSGDTSSGDTSPGDTSSGDTSSGDTSSGDTSSGDTSSGDTSSGSNASSGNNGSSGNNNGHAHGNCNNHC